LAPVKLELSTVSPQVFDRQRESGKISLTWHHAGAARGVSVRRIAWPVVRWHPPTVAAWAARQHQQLETRRRRSLVIAVAAGSACCPALFDGDLLDANEVADDVSRFRFDPCCGQSPVKFLTQRQRKK
jgi:hypothetical protein